MKRIGSFLLIFMMLFSMIPTAFADTTTGYSGVSALTALFLSADVQDVFDAYDTALAYIDESSGFYSSAPEAFRNAIEVELSETTFISLYDETKAALDSQAQSSKAQIYNDLAGVVSGQAPELINSINNMDLDLNDGSNVGTVVYYMGKLAQEKKIATYDSYTGELEFDLGRIPGSTLMDVNDGQTLKFGSTSDTYRVEEVVEAIFTNVGSGFDFDGVVADLEVYLNGELDAFLDADDANRQSMVDALNAFGFLHTYSTKPSTGGGGGGIIIPPTVEPEPENPGVVGDDAVEVTEGETVTEVTVDGDSIETAVEQAASAAEEGTPVVIAIPETAVPDEAAEQVVITLPKAAVEALAEGDVDVLIDLGGIELTIPAAAFDDSVGDLNLQFIRTTTPTSLEAAIEDPELRQVTVTRGLAPGFDINALLVEHAGQTRLTDHSANPLHFELPLVDILPAYYDTLGLYYYNPNTGYYEFVSGQVKDGKIVAELTHLSEYVILNVVTNFTDMTSHWANRYVKSMAAKHVVNGVGEGKFIPEDPVTRAEFIKMLVNVKNLSLEGAPSFYSDVNAEDWFKPYVDAAYANGLVYGGTVSSFLPNQNASRLEMMMMLSYAIDEELSEEEANQILAAYTDANEIPSLNRVDLAKVIKAGLIEGYDGKLLLNDGLKRSEAAAVMYRLFNR